MISVAFVPKNASYRSSNAFDSRLLNVVVTAAGILPDGVLVVARLATVLEAVDAAGRHHGMGRRTDEPVRRIELVAGELRKQSARILPIQPPVPEMVERRVSPLRCVVVGRRRHAGAPPAAVAVPGETHVVNVAEQLPLDDAGVGGAVNGVVVALISNFEHRAGFAGRRDHPFTADDVPRHHLLAEDVLARGERLRHDVGVRPQRDGHDDRLDGPHVRALSLRST
jgi:hypothetical protein